MHISDRFSEVPPLGVTLKYRGKYKPLQNCSPDTGELHMVTEAA